MKPRMKRGRQNRAPHQPTPVASRPFSYGLPRAMVLRLLSGDFSRGDYRAYLRTDWWVGKRFEALTFYGRACTLCGCGLGNTQVHHRGRQAYRHLFREDVRRHLTVLCRRCHSRHHST